MIRLDVWEKNGTEPDHICPAADCELEITAHSHGTYRCIREFFEECMGCLETFSNDFRIVAMRTDTHNPL